jgi:hypothetical protein
MLLQCDTDSYVLYPSTVTQKHNPEPFDTSVHRWNAATGGIETWLLGSDSDPLGWAKGGPEWWYVTVEWHLVDGAPMPTAFNVRASGSRTGDSLKPISRDLTKRLPLGEITTQGLEQLMAFHDGVTLAFDADTAERRATSAALSAGKPRSMDNVYRRAHAIHSQALANKHPQPSLWTWHQLVAEGVTTRSGEEPTYENVRTKWIPKGKALDTKNARRP